MQISGESNNLDLYSEAREWCGIPVTDTTTLPLPVFVRSANFGLDRVNMLALRANGKWQKNDSNQTNELLDVTTNLVAGTEKYAISITWLKIWRVRVKDQEGIFRTLIPVDRRQLSDRRLNEDAGDPKRYDKMGNFIYPFPKPSYSSPGGMEVQFQQGASYFAFDDTTKQPGFDSDFHRLIALYGAADYCDKNDLEKRTAKIMAKIGRPPLDRVPGNGLEGELIERYTQRDEDQKVGLRVSRQDYGQYYRDNNSRNNGIYNPNGFNF